IGGWKHSLDPVESELVIARTCIDYLMFTVFDNGIVGDMTSHGYFNYASWFWPIHYRRAQKRATNKLLQPVLELCDPQSPRFQSWFKEYWSIPFGNSAQCISSVMVGAYFGLD